MSEPGDDDPTPPRRPRSHWGAEQRAHVGREHRQGEAHASTAGERRRAASSARPPDHVERELGPLPNDFGGREITEPWEILDRQELRPEENRIIERSRRNSEDPLTLADGAKMMARIIRRELDDRSEKKQRADEMMAIIDTTPSGQLAARVAALESQLAELARQIGTPHSENKGTIQENVTRFRSMRSVAIWLAGAAFAVASSAFTYVATSIKTSGADEVRLERDERDIGQTQQDLREIRRALERRKDTQ